MDQDKQRELAASIMRELKRADATIADAHGAVIRTAMQSMDCVLTEAAAAGAVVEVQAWLDHQLDALRMFVAGWQPGAESSSSSRLH